jgi:actin-related protein 3
VVEDGNILDEYAKFDQRLNNDKWRKKFDKYIEGVDPLTQAPFSVAVGPERFLAAEMFFNPEIVDEKYRDSIDALVDQVIQLSPIDVRRKLYSNIALSGGSTLFSGFKKRLENGIQKRVNDRLKKYENFSKSKVNSYYNTVYSD